MKIIYNSGKFTGLPEEEAYKKFEKYTQLLEEKGYKVIDPTLLVPKGTSYDDAMHICLNAVGFAEAIFMQPDWMQSEGACKELMKAQMEGERIYWNIEDVPALPGSPATLSGMIQSIGEMKKFIGDLPFPNGAFRVVDEKPQEHKQELCYNNCCFIYRNVRFTIDHEVTVSTADFYPQFKYSVDQRSKERLYFPTHEEALRAKSEIEDLQELAKKRIAE